MLKMKKFIKVQKVNFAQTGRAFRSMFVPPVSVLGARLEATLRLPSGWIELSRVVGGG